jgi:hypothetical protein
MTSTPALPPMLTTLKGNVAASLCTSASSNERPIRRFASYTVLAGRSAA